MEQFIATGRERIASIFDDQATQLAINMATGSSAFDHFLSKVAAFLEAHSVLHPDLKDDPSLIHIEAIPRNAGFDAQGIERGETDQTETHRRSSLEQRLPYRFAI